MSISWFGNPNVGCLLDRIFVSKNIVDNIEHVLFVPTCFSDHDLLKCKMSSFDTRVDVGKGYWKFNNALLDDVDFIGKIRACIFAAHENVDDSTDLTVWWDKLKMSFKTLAIRHSTYLAKEKNKMVSALTAQYVLAEKLGKLDNMQRVKEKLKELETKRLDGSKIRSRALLLDNKEQPSTFFYRKEMSKGKKKLITKIINDENIVCDNNNSISESFVDFYSNLYRKEPVVQPPLTYTTDLPTLDQLSTEHLGDAVDDKDIKLAISQMENNKTPGPDGLTKEFYSTFSKELVPILCIVFATIYEKGCLSQSQKLSYISLLCKKPDEPELCKNYRPISLLNVDYKILTKVLCSRLRLCLSEIIHPDQTCSVPGRSIFDNCHLIRDLINDVNSNPKDYGILLSTDQEKAFDRVDHTYMLRILRHFGFSENFVNWISILYKDISSAVIVNGHVSNSFPVQRSVRQGCPLSPLLYVICLEPVLHAIRNDTDIQGLHVPGVSAPCKLSAFADDCKFFLKNSTSAQRVISHFQTFGDFSGAKLNHGKCEAMFLGKLRNCKDFPLRLRWVNQMTIFGIKFGDVTEDDIWYSVYKKIEKTVNLFKTRPLSYYGKAKLVNVMALSKLWYIATVIPLSKHYVRLLNKLIFSFIWAPSKMETVARKTMYLPRSEGGIGLVNISLKAQSLILAQVVKVFMDRQSTWIAYGHKYLGLVLRRFTGYLFCNNRPHCMEDPPSFYKLCLDYIQNILVKDANFVFKPGLTCKSLYTLLLNLEKTVPHCVSKWYYINFKNVFSNICHKIVDSNVINVSFKIAHDIIPVNDRLHSWNIYKVQPFCKSCLPKRTREDTIHCFWDCPTIQLAKIWIQKAFRLICNITLTAEIVRFGDLPAHISRKDLAIYFLSEFRYAVWVSRCKYTMDNHFKPTQDTVLQMFISRVNNRIIIDKCRLSQSEFDKQWILPGLAGFNKRGNLVVRLSSVNSFRL